MNIDPKAVHEAKEALGEGNALQIAELLDMDLDERNLKALCPFHHEDTPSFVYDKKHFRFHCFGCQKNVDIIDAFMLKGRTYIEAVKELFRLAGVRYSFGMQGVREFGSEYRYPHDEGTQDIARAAEYWASRGISENTLRHCGIGQDAQGNTAFRYLDSNDVLTMVKYRPSRKVEHGQSKAWAQKGADTHPLLFNMNRINMSEPLLITEGECFPGDAEVLTPEGWVRLGEYSGQQVLQVDAERKGSFVTPRAYVKKPFSGKLVRCSSDELGYYSATTPEHNMVVEDFDTHELSKVKARDIQKADALIPLSAEVDGPGIRLSNDQLFLCAAAHSELAVNGPERDRVTLHLRSRSQYDACAAALNRAGVNHSAINSPGKQFNCLVMFARPEWLPVKLPMNWIVGASVAQRKRLLDFFMILRRDGRYGTVSTPSSDVAEFIELLAHTCGASALRREGLNQYGARCLVSIYFQPSALAASYLEREDVAYEGDVYCVSVPSGMILTRQHGCISVSGNCDCLSAIEAGYMNAVSVPFGAGNFTWIDANWDWLDRFGTIIVCGDNDKPGQEMNRELAHRLGLWRTRVVELPDTFTDEDGNVTAISDINDVLCAYGGETVIQCILKAKQSPIDTVADVADIADVEINELDGLYTGLECLDSELSRSLLYGSLNILTGINGCVDCDTEFLSRDGWKRMDEYREGDEVLIFNDDGTAVFEEPLDYTKAPADEMLAFQSPGVRQTVTPEHTMIYVDEQGSLSRMPAQELAQLHAQGEFKGRFLQTFCYIPERYPHNITNLELRLQAITIMLGHKAGSGTLENCVTVASESLNDIHYIEQLLTQANISSSRVKRRGRYYLTYKPPRTMRRFEGVYWKLNRGQSKVVYKEICRWRMKRVGFHRVCACMTREEAGYAQFLQASMGIPTRLVESNGLDVHGNECGEYLLMPLDARTSPRLDPNIPALPAQAGDGFKYCFTVTSGMFVTRREGIINITGNSGKSSFLSQLICQCLEQGRDAWLYSMELPNYMARSWMQYVMAGPRNVAEKRDPRGRVYYTVPREIKEKIDRYWKGRVFVYKDGCRNTIGDILQSMEESARRFGCKLFVLDNLTAINIEANENNKWDKQNETVTRLIDFAKKFDVAVILVVHPRKMEMVRRMSKFDVQGSGGMVDLAHRAFSLYRVSPREKQGVPNKYGDGWKIPPIKHDVLLDVLKDRFTGRENMEVGLFFDRASMRFFGNKRELNYQYAWEDKKIPESEWIWPDRCNVEDCPF